MTKKITLKQKYDKWVMLFSWDGKDVSYTTTKPMYCGWYAVRVILNKHTLACKAIPAYWNGTDWVSNDTNEAKPLNNMFAYCQHVQMNKDEAEEICDLYDPDKFSDPLAY